jgi:hypothetical protein
VALEIHNFPTGECGPCDAAIVCGDSGTDRMAGRAANGVPIRLSEFDMEKFSRCVGYDFACSETREHALSGEYLGVGHFWVFRFRSLGQWPPGELFLRIMVGIKLFCLTRKKSMVKKTFKRIDH